MTGAGSFLRTLPLLALLGGCAAPSGYIPAPGNAHTVSLGPGHEAEERLMGNEGGLWAVRWDDETGAPLRISNELVETGAAGRHPRPFDAIAVTGTFIRRNAAIFPLRPGLDSLALVRVTQSRRMVRVRLEQRLRGVPVEGGGYTVALSPDGQVSGVVGRYFPYLEPPASPWISSGDARAIAEKFVGVQAGATEPELLMSRWRGQFRTTYTVGVRRNAFNHWRVRVDAVRGMVLDWRVNQPVRGYVIIDPR